MVHVPRSVLLALCAALLGLCCAAAASAPAATPKTKWLCRPGVKPDPCTPGLATTRIAPTGELQGTFTPSSTAKPKIDCFYVYPTVSNQNRPAATLKVDPEERSIALYQAARYETECKVYAPMYRQVTIQGLLNPTRVTAKMQTTAYNDVRRAFREYLKKYNKGRGIVFVSHSQGSFVLRQLLAAEVDKKPAVRKRLVSGLLLGGNVTDGDFKKIKPCTGATQLGCVVAFSTYGAVPPADALFGRPSGGKNIICTNPAALGGGSAPIDAVYPSAPFAPGTAIGLLT